MRQFARASPADAVRADSMREPGSGTVDRLATIVLDRLGTVRYCHDEAADLFGSPALSLIGKHIKALIPDLPFNARTPGYNVAYAAFWAPDGPRQRYCGVDSLGRSFDLQIALESLELEKKQQIVLNLRRAL
ncbi:MAG: hypothetical protein HYY28_02745 [Betaproteobacteria bacterium]|nr:hypothetical protein [Betaproteobacteria bacterium]